MTTPNGQEAGLTRTERALCQIIREPAFDASVKQLADNYSRMYELDHAIDQALLRFKEGVFDEIGNDYYAWRTDKIMNFPELRIVFKYKKSTNIITLVDIEEILT